MNTDNKAISAQTSSKEDAALPFTGGDWYKWYKLHPEKIRIYI